MLFLCLPEYDKKSLLKEYQREIENFINGLRSDYPPLPNDYFSKDSLQLLNEIEKTTMKRMIKPILPEDDLLTKIDINWQKSGRILYKNWLNILSNKKKSS